MRGTPGPIHVLHVDDDPDFVDLIGTFLEGEGEQFTVESAPSATVGVDRLAAGDVDCIVSDYDMPGQNGIEFLNTVREEYPTLPFILYTGQGSADVASEAIAAGATDYLQKESGLEQYDVLAHRIRHAVARARAEQKAAENERRLRELTEPTTDIHWVFTHDWGELLFVSSPYEDIFGRSMERLREASQDFLNGIHPEDRAQVKAAMATLSHGEVSDVEYRVNPGMDYRRWIWSHGEPIYDEAGNVVRIAGFTRDITDRKEQGS